MISFMEQFDEPCRAFRPWQQYQSGSPCTVRIEESDTEGFVGGWVSDGRYVRPTISIDLRTSQACAGSDVARWANLMTEPHNPLEAMCHYRNSHSTDRLPPEPVSTAKEAPAGILACAGFDGRPGAWK